MSRLDDGAASGTPAARVDLERRHSPVSHFIDQGRYLCGVNHGSTDIRVDRRIAVQEWAARKDSRRSLWVLPCDARHERRGHDLVPCAAN
jgi:hypothetical protein